MKSTSRRNALKAGLTVGLSAAGLAAFKLFSQTEAEESGETVQLLSPDGEIVEVDSGYLKPVPEVDHHACGHMHGREGIPNRRFVMVIDLARCKNLRKCHDACEHMHELGEDKEWLKVVKMQDNELTTPYWQPILCFHCDQPPCVKVCPVDATFKRDDGLVLVDTDRCVGCRFCMVACPYSARTFDWSDPGESVPASETEYSPESSVPHKMGTVSKCDFCPHMVREGKLPSCVTSCPNGVFYFGDENEDSVSNGDMTVKLNELLEERGGYRFMEELGTKPRVYYLPPVNRAFEFEDDEFTKESNHGQE